jgi:hypothetical protein
MALKYANNWLNFEKKYYRSYTIYCDLVRIIWLHEWSHCIHGHIDVASNTLGIEKLFDFQNENEPADITQTLIFQCIEFEADRTSIASITSQILQGFDFSALVHEAAGFNVDLADRVALLNLAIFVFSAVWKAKEFLRGDETRVSIEPFETNTESTHPPPLIRYLSMIKFMYTWVTKLSIQRGICGPANANDELTKNQATSAIINRYPSASVLEVAARIKSSHYIGEIIKRAPQFGDYLNAHSPTTTFGILNNPLSSYYSITNKAMTDLRSKIYNNIFIRHQDGTYNKKDYENCYTHLVLNANNSHSSYDDLLDANS